MNEQQQQQQQWHRAAPERKEKKTNELTDKQKKLKLNLKTTEFCSLLSNSKFFFRFSQTTTI